MTSNITVTGHAGPNKTVTAANFTGVSELHMDFYRGMLTFKAQGTWHEMPLDEVATLTDTISAAGGTHAVVSST